MTDRFLKLPEVMERTSLSRRSVYRKMDNGEFPRSVQLGTNSVAWRESEVTKWMENPMEWKIEAVESNA